MTTLTAAASSILSALDVEILLGSLSLECPEFSEYYTRAIHREMKWAALYLYTQHYYIGCNRALRYGLYPQMAKLLDEELNQMTPTPGIAYRGQSRRSFEKCLIHKDGKVFFQDKGYLSSSRSKDVAIEYTWKAANPSEAVVLKLYGPGYDISEFSEYPREQEVLWRHHAMFEVFREEDAGGGLTIYHLRKT